MAAFTVKAGQAETLNIMGMPLRFLCDARETGGAWSLMEEDISLGHGPAVHRHDWDEAYYIIDGSLDFMIGDRIERLERGDFAYLPRSTVHGFKGASDVPARVMIFAAPAHARDFFEDVDREVRKMPEDLSKIPEIGRRHGIEFVS